MIDKTPNNISNHSGSVWMCLAIILLVGLTLRLAGIWRSEPINYHPDEDKIARPVFLIANNAQIGLKRDYNWPICGVIYPLGYSLYSLKGLFGPYSYNSILVIQRVLSGLIATGVIFAVFLFMRKLFSVRTGLLAAGLLAVALQPVLYGLEGLFRSLVPLITILIMLLSYDLFDLKKDQKNPLQTGRCCSMGFLVGWGIAVRWTILMTSIPVAGAFLLSVWFNRKAKNWGDFAKINFKKIMIIAVIAVLSFLAAIPDFQLAPQKVLAGVMLHKQQGKVGHYGQFSDRSNALMYKLSTLTDLMSKCGSIYLFIAGIAATIFCSARLTRAKIFLLWTMIIWLIVVNRNVLPIQRYYLIPFMIMLFFIAMAVDEILKSPKRWLKFTAFPTYAVVIVIGSLYTLINISPLWKPDARIQCSEWIKANVPTGSGVTWAPRTHNWMAPGGWVAPSLFEMYPRRAKPGKEQYLIAANSVMNIFKDHPPEKKINPDDWYPSKPPDLSTLILYAEMNAGGGQHLSLVKEFYAEHKFLGLGLRLFGQDKLKSTSHVNCAVSLFVLNKPDRK